MCSFWIYGSCVVNPIIHGLVPRPPPYEIRQCRILVPLTGSFKNFWRAVRGGSEEPLHYPLSIPLAALTLLCLSGQQNSELQLHMARRENTHENKYISIQWVLRVSREERRKFCNAFDKSFNNFFLIPEVFHTREVHFNSQQGLNSFKLV